MEPGHPPPVSTSAANVPISTPSTTEPTVPASASIHLPSIAPAGTTYPGGIDVLYREIPHDCQKLIQAADIADSANQRGYFTVCELLALKAVLVSRYHAEMNGGIAPAEEPPQPVADEQPTECKPFTGSERLRPSKLARLNANGVTGAGSKRRSSWSSGSVDQRGPKSSVQGTAEQASASSAQYISTTSAGILNTSTSGQIPAYAVCRMECCMGPAARPGYYLPTGNACEGMGSMAIDQKPLLQQLQPQIPASNSPAMYYGGSQSHPSSSTIHYTVNGISVCPPTPQPPSILGPTRPFSPYPCPPYYPYYGQCDGGSQIQNQYPQQQEAAIRSVAPPPPPPPQEPAPVPVPASAPSGREIRHGLPPPPPYRSLSLVMRLLQIGNYSFRSFSEVNPNRCKVLFNTQHIVYECYLPIVQPIRETFQPLRKLLTIDVKFEQISQLQFDTDKLFLRVDGAPGLTITYNPIPLEDNVVSTLNPQDQFLLDHIENGQLRLSPYHQLYFLNERLVQNLRAHFREMPQFRRFFQHGIGQDMRYEMRHEMSMNSNTGLPVPTQQLTPISSNQTEANMGLSLSAPMENKNLDLEDKKSMPPPPPPTTNGQMELPMELPPQVEEHKKSPFQDQAVYESDLVIVEQDERSIPILPASSGSWSGPSTSVIHTHTAMAMGGPCAYHQQGQDQCHNQQ